MTWQPLSQRTQGLQPDGPYDGVPTHLETPLVDWFKRQVFDGRYYRSTVLRSVGSRLRLEVDPNWSLSRVVDNYVVWCRSDDELFVDVVDCVLDLRSDDPGWSGPASLDALLADAGSVWRVNSGRNGLERRVSSELGSTVVAATAPGDEASNHLREAWSSAFGRNGSPSHAWVEGIKTLESLLCPVVVGNKAKPTLGDVLGVLRANNGDKWRGSLPGKDKDHPVAPVVGALELVWPNPDRHGGPPPSAEEARSVVSVVAALVQAHRETPLVYKVP